MPFCSNQGRCYYSGSPSHRHHFPYPCSHPGQCCCCPRGLFLCGPCLEEVLHPGLPHSAYSISSQASPEGPPPKRAWTSGPGESSTSRPWAPPSPPYQFIVGAPDLSPASIIRRLYFHCSPIPRNADCSARDLHGEVYYDLPAFAEDPELQESMLLVQIYHMEPFMTPRRYFNPWVVIEFYHKMTSRREANPTALHFSIDSRLGILRASDITAALHLPVVLANTTVYRQWLYPSIREMVHLLSMDTTAGTILFRRQLPQHILLIDHILQSNLFSLQHIVQRR